VASERTHRPVIDPSKCKLCELCRWLCPDLAITRDDREERIRLDLKYCKGCGICAAFCPKGSILMVRESEAGSQAEPEDG
jgi:pyruvate ferredoxin oxidoreductase delta subunit